MKKDSLKDWFKLEVWRQSGGTLPELCDLADIREWINETTPVPETAPAPDLGAAITPEAPTAPVASSVSLPIGTGISLDFTAKTKGASGDDISITMVDPEAIKELSMSIHENEITVDLGSDGTTVTSSLNDIKTAIEESPADELVQVSITGDSDTKAIGVIETFLEGGVDGTVGAAGALRFDSSKLYVSVDESTTAVSNWKSVALT